MSLVEMITQILVSVDARLDQLGIVPVQLSGSRVPCDECSTKNASISVVIHIRNDAHGR